MLFDRIPLLLDGVAEIGDVEVDAARCRDAVFLLMRRGIHLEHDAIALLPLRGTSMLVCFCLTIVVVRC